MHRNRRVGRAGVHRERAGRPAAMLPAPTPISTRTPTAIPADHPLMWLSWPATERIRPTVVVPPPVTPRMTGIWRTTISTAIPARSPSMTGVERNSAIHPRRQRPTTTSSADQQRGEGHHGAVAGGRRCRRRHADGEYGGDGGVRTD